MTTKNTTKQSQSTKKILQNIDTALFEFQALNITVPRNAKGTIEGKEYMYADIEDINTVINPALQKCGLVLSTTVDNEFLFINLIHPTTGTLKTSKMNLGLVSSSHEMGSRMTHYRRYGIAALLNLVLDKPIEQTTNTAPSQNTENKPEIPQKDKSPFFIKANNSILSTATSEALEEIKNQIKRSVKLTDDEKTELLNIAQNHDNEINGSIS